MAGAGQDSEKQERERQALIKEKAGYRFRYPAKSLLIDKFREDYFLGYPAFATLIRDFIHIP